MTDELNDDMYELDEYGNVVIKTEDTYIIAGKVVHLNAQIHEYCENETLSTMQCILDSNAQKIARPDWDYSQVTIIMDYIKEHLAHIESKIKKAIYSEYDGIGVDYEKVKLIRDFFSKIDKDYSTGSPFREKTETRVQELENAADLYMVRLKTMIYYGTRTRCEFTEEDGKEE